MKNQLLLKIQKIIISKIRKMLKNNEIDL